MENTEELKRAEAHLERAEAELHAAESLERKAEHDVQEALEEVQEVLKPHEVLLEIATPKGLLRGYSRKRPRFQRSLKSSSTRRASTRKTPSNSSVTARCFSQPTEPLKASVSNARRNWNSLPPARAYR